MAQYLGNWSEREEVIGDFFPGYDAKNSTVPDDFPTEEEIIVAEYIYRDYSGEAFVLYERGGVLFEAEGYHCSCNGLEGQWSPEETTIGALRIRKWDSEELAAVIGAIR